MSRRTLERTADGSTPGERTINRRTVLEGTGSAGAGSLELTGSTATL
jgi:hypothetical protein